MMQLIGVHLIVLFVGLCVGFWFSDGKIGFSRSEFRLAAIIAFMVIGMQFFVEQTSHGRALHLLLSLGILYVGASAGERVRIALEEKIFSSIKLEESRYTMWGFVQSLEELLENIKEQPSILEQFRDDFLANYRIVMSTLSSIENFGNFVKDKELVTLIQHIKSSIDQLHELLMDDQLTIDDVKEMKQLVSRLQEVLEKTLDLTQKRFVYYRERFVQLGLFFLKHGRA